MEIKLPLWIDIRRIFGVLFLDLGAYFPTSMLQPILKGFWDRFFVLGDCFLFDGISKGSEFIQIVKDNIVFWMKINCWRHQF